VDGRHQGAAEDAGKQALTDEGIATAGIEQAPGAKKDRVRVTMRLGEWWRAETAPSRPPR